MTYLTIHSPIFDVVAIFRKHEIVEILFCSCLQLGTSPLHFSAQYGHLSTAEVLLRAGISRDARTKVDRTPLHVAAQEGHSDIVTLLLQHAADIDAKDMVRPLPPPPGFCFDLDLPMRQC